MYIYTVSFCLAGLVISFCLNITLLVGKTPPTDQMAGDDRNIYIFHIFLNQTKTWIRGCLPRARCAWSRRRVTLVTTTAAKSTLAFPVRCPPTSPWFPRPRAGPAPLTHQQTQPVLDLLRTARTRPATFAEITAYQFSQVQTSPDISQLRQSAHGQ